MIADSIFIIPENMSHSGIWHNLHMCFFAKVVEELKFVEVFQTFIQIPPVLQPYISLVTLTQAWEKPTA
jgi:hypothetical protein